MKQGKANGLQFGCARSGGKWRGYIADLPDSPGRLRGRRRKPVTGGRARTSLYARLKIIINLLG
ncbi:hypothetical protein HYN43_013415 [Mucilaginibacter celer]|uniref:Uncharacterized protein n=1 Tax=Mucilaginibacter celer TaxID=2305508 RepID=A0A494VS53_9SPHI|nr:hypothetical protein HYN43_013415 [Mucilaginibacter celer]